MMKILKWVLKSILFGLVFIFLFNLIGVYFNLNIPFNIYNVFLIGFFKVPGLVILLILNVL